MRSIFISSSSRVERVKEDIFIALDLQDPPLLTLNDKNMMNHTFEVMIHPQSQDVHINHPIIKGEDPLRSQMGNLPAM